MLEPIPDREKIEIKDKFVEHYKQLLGNRYDEFMEYSLSYIRKCIRVNTLKIPIPNLKKRLSRNWKLIPVPWCKEGFWIEYKDKKRFDIGNTPEHNLGYIYVQDAASMIPPVVLDPKPDEMVLDMCAAPGSKSTQIAGMMKNKGLLISNELLGDRIKALGLNKERCGVHNAILTQMSGNWFKKTEFDKVLVDAPCSATGTIRRSLKTLKMWSPNSVKQMAGLQSRLLESGFKVLKPGGTLVYSTCTLEPLEDEGMVSSLLKNFDNAKLMPIKLKIKQSDPITKWENIDIHPSVKHCLRIYPQDNDTEGFFVAKIKKI